MVLWEAAKEGLGAAEEEAGAEAAAVPVDDALGEGAAGVDEGRGEGVLRIQAAAVVELTGLVKYAGQGVGAVALAGQKKPLGQGVG